MANIEDRKSVQEESGVFQINSWYDNLLEISKIQDIRQRYISLVQLHQKTLEFYLPAIRAITPKIAASINSDGRPRLLVVAHIMGWEEWQVQIFGDSDREERLKKQMILRDFFDSDKGKMVDFKNVDEFNAYNAQRYTGKPWKEIQQKAIITAKQLQSFFPPNPEQQWIDFLETTPEHKWKILPETTITIPSAWYLWMVSLEHEAVSHRKDILS